MAVSSLSFRAYVSNLSGRRLGAFKTAAVKLGITFEDYIGRIERGQKNCIDCRQWKDRGDFNVDMSRWDGLSSKCRIHLRDKKGGTMEEWPESLRVRQFPRTEAATK